MILMKFKTDIPAIVDSIEINVFKNITGFVYCFIHCFSKGGNTENPSAIRQDLISFGFRSRMENQTVFRDAYIEAGNFKSFFVAARVSPAHGDHGTSNPFVLFYFYFMKAFFGAGNKQ